MKILMMVSHFFPAGVGGAERQCWRQAQALARRGHEVKILTKWLVPDSARHEQRDGIHIWRRGCYFSVRKSIWTRGGSPGPDGMRVPGFESADQPGGAPAGRSRGRVVSAQVRNLLFMADVAWGVAMGRFRADVIHVHESHWIAGFAQWMGAWLGIPVLCKEATQPALVYAASPEVPWDATWKARRLRCRFIAMTDGIARELVTAGIPESRMVRVPNGVEIPDLVADPGRHADALYVGNFTQGSGFKGFDVLLQAWGIVHRQEPGMRLRLYGRGDVRAWKTYAEACGCGDSVVFEGETQDIGAAHRQSGMLIVPSRQEGLSNALLEALAAGLPAVVTDIPGNTAVVRHGVEGRVVPVDDGGAMAAAILELARSPELRVTLGRAARVRAEEVFSIAKVAEQLEAAYRTAIEAGRS